MDEADIGKLLQKKKEHSLKIKIDENMNRKWELKQTLKTTEKDIKVFIYFIFIIPLITEYNLFYKLKHSLIVIESQQRTGRL